MDIKKFSFNRDGNKIVASNGPITVVFNIVPTGLVINETQTNVKTSWEHMPRVALAAARWHRQNSPRALSTIAMEISRDWKNVNYAARPYLGAMLRLGNINDSDGADSARGIVQYFLSNAGSWRGETAKRIKTELKEMLK